MLSSFLNTFPVFSPQYLAAGPHFPCLDSRVLTTFLNYGEFACQRQGEIIRDLATPQRAMPTDVDKIAEAVYKKLCLSKFDEFVKS
jgi:hypothetical protein